jgi:hypothetical protein
MTGGLAVGRRNTGRAARNYELSHGGHCTPLAFATGYTIIGTASKSLSEASDGQNLAVGRGWLDTLGQSIAARI